jgi:hypothetical protein
VTRSLACVNDYCMVHTLIGHVKSWYDIQATSRKLARGCGATGGPM